MSRTMFVFEMANNHQGDVKHGKTIIKEIKKVCDGFLEFDFAFKFQYRDLDTFIHPSYKNRMDIKNVKRFQDTRLSQEQFGELYDCVKENDFLAICTAFDEVSVRRIQEQKYDYIKIASCSFTDWPLLEEVAKTNLPVIASGAGSGLEDVKRVVSFFTNRNKNFSLMHCVAEYPTENKNLQLNQIDFYRNLFPGIRIGFSTHESPENMTPVKIAVAKGAQIFEKHVGVPVDEITLNGYSANPDQVRAWLESAREAYEICGVEGERYQPSEKEIKDLLALRRGVFAKCDIASQEKLNADKYYLAFPSSEGQLTASDLSKYNTIVLEEDASTDEAIMMEDVSMSDNQKETLAAVKKVVNLLKESDVVVPSGSQCEVSHHYGIKHFEETGVAMIECVNREYCKKILVVLPGQSHPSHHHKKKEESFIVLYGDLTLTLDGEEKHLKKGDVVTVCQNVEHSFSSQNGCVFEEISSTHFVDDSYYALADTFVTSRKTMVHFTSEMLDELA